MERNKGTERQRDRERDWEKHQCERETLTGCLSFEPWLGIQPRNILVYGMMLQPNEPSGEGSCHSFKKLKITKILIDIYK